jgi:hypothetical protein
VDTLVQALCFFCVTVGSLPAPQLSQRAAGDIWYTHESPARGTHLLRLSTTDVIVDSDPYREQRLYAFAHQFAEQTCRGRFSLSEAERASWPKVRPIYAKQYVFRCR